MASFLNHGTYFEWIDDERSKYTLGNKYTDIPTSAFQSLVTQVIPPYTKLRQVDMGLYWKTSVGGSNGDAYLYIGDAHVGGEWNTSNKWVENWTNGVQGYFQSGTANAGLPSSGIRVRTEASWGRTFYFNVKIRWYPIYKITVNGGTGSGEYNMGSTVTIKATVPTGYEFVKWNDGNTSVQRTVSVTSNATYTAEFKPQKIEFSVQMDLFNSNYYTEDEKNYIMNYCKDIVLDGSGTYDYGSTVKLKCENLPKKIDIQHWIAYEDDSSYNIYLTTWSEKAPSFQIGEAFLSSIPDNTVYKKIKIVLFIAPQTCYITPEVSPYKDAGNIKIVNSEGQEISFQEEAAFSFGQVYTFRIKENHSYQYSFIGWSDGTANLDIKIRVIDDFTLTAYFEIRRYKVTVSANPLEGGTIKQYLRDGTEVTGETIFEYGTFIDFVITPNEGYSIDMSGGLIGSLTVIGDFTEEIFFKKIKYTLNISISPSGGGEVIGEKEYEYGDIVRLEAIPSLGYKFVKWNENLYDNPLTTTANDDIALHYTAYFEPLAPKFKSVKIYYPTGINEASPTNPLVAGKEAQIIVKIAME